MTSTDSSLAVVVPALNEEGTIGEIVSAIRKKGYDVIVVDDGSEDKTGLLALERGAKIITHKSTLGYEEALSTGVYHAITKGYLFFATFDADGQFDPEDLERLLEVQIKENSDIVIGIRSHLNRVSEHIINFYGRFKFGISDPLCGLKLYRSSSASKYLPFDRLQLVGMELACRMVMAGCKMCECSVAVRPRRDGSRYGQSFGGELKILRAFFTTIKVFGLRSKVNKK